MAYLSMIVTNLVKAIHGKEGDKIAVPLDFMPNWGKGEEDVVKETGQTQEEMKRIMMGIAKASRKRRPQNTDVQKRVRTKTRK